jgi:signal transduction histidine kinase
VLSVTGFLRSLRTSGRFGPPQIFALILTLMIMATFAVVLGVGIAGEAITHIATIRGGVQLQRWAENLDSTQTAMWLLVVAQALIAGTGAWALQREGRRARLRGQCEAENFQALLERLSIATQAAGIYCWELDWSTYAITWDASRLPAAEVAAASRRHFGAELGSDLFKWVHPDDQRAGSKAIAESLARGEDHASFRYRIVLPDQTIRHVQAFARTYTDAAGKPQRSLGVSWDVTQEVEAAERAARDAAKERELLERLSVATHAAGVQCWESDFGRAKLTWLDFGLGTDRPTPESVQEAGDVLYALIVPEDLQAMKDLADAAMLRNEPMISARYRRRDPDGTVHYIQTYQRFFYDQHGKPTRTLGADVDITEAFQRQAELEALSIRFGIATRAAQAGVWEWQESSDELWWDDTMYAIYALPVETFRPTHASVVAMIHPDDLALAQAAWDSALGESNQLRVQFRVVRPDGSIVHVDSLAAVVTDSSTSHRRLVGITLDISERVNAEQRERLLQKQLRESSHQSGMAEVATGVLHNVGNVLNSLGISSATAQARLRASQFDRVERVAAMLDTHRNVLGEFLASDPRGKRVPEYLSALGARLKKDAEGLQREIDAINGHVNYLREIVRAQQSFARVGGAEEAVNVCELVESALTLKSQELNGAEVARHIAEVPEVWTDRYKLLQIVVNFIANACDAVAGNEPGARHITIRAGLVRGQIEIAVEDSGTGIPADLLPRVWEFGFTTKTHGHGFGLHSAAVAAQELGATVAADSAGAGQGACFSVKIPIRVATDGVREAVA